MSPDGWHRNAGLAILVLVVLAIIIHSFPSCESEASAKKKCDKTTLICGYEYGKAFLKPNSKKGKKYRRNVSRMIVRFKGWLVVYAPYEVVEMASRILLESRGNWWSYTKDTTIHEAALCSNGYSFTRQVCIDWGICGDPCGDPEFSIALGAWRRYLSRLQMIYAELAENGKDSFWYPWLLEQCKQNRFECEVIMGACGSINCQKLRKAMDYAGSNSVDTVGKDGAMHSWWKTINYLKVQDQAKINHIFAPKKNLWQIGSRLGRSVAMKFMRAEFYECLGYDEEGKPIPNFCWGPEKYIAYFPFRTEMWPDESGVLVPIQVPDFPTPLYPTGPKFMKFEDWRKRCVLYGPTKKWKTATGEPKKKNARYKKSACVDGVCWKKGQKKYPDFQAAHDGWEDECREKGELPSLELQSWADEELERMGCKLVLFD